MLYTLRLIAERKSEKVLIPIFIVFGLTRPGIEPKFTASIADALSTQQFFLLTANDIAVTKFSLIWS